MDTSRSTVESLREPRAVTRRVVLGKALGLSAAAVAAGVATKLTMSDARAATQYKTTAALNFRAGPGTSYAILAVIPAGTIVAHTGGSQNGFYEVGYNGTYGWVSATYLAPYSASPPVVIGAAITTTAVNLRSGPSTSNQILRVVAKGVTVQISNTVRNGYRYVIHDGLAGWIIDGALTTVPGDGPYDPNYATTTAALNLRAEPSVSAKILTVMPSGAQVKFLDGYANGYRRVTYDGTAGWAATAYLN